MNIAILAPSITATIDGVADYSLRLGEELTRQGHRVLIVGVNDFHAEGRPFTKNAEGLRLRNFCYQQALQERLPQLQDELTAFKAELILVQYYWRGFWAGSAYKSLIQLLRSLGPSCTKAIMYHETWDEVGKTTRLPTWLRSSIVALTMRYFHSRVGFKNAYTSNRFYQGQLKRLAIFTRLLPVPSNIERVAHDQEATARLHRELEAELKSPFQAKSACLTIVFGRIQPDLKLTHLPSELRAMQARLNKQSTLVVSVGKTSYNDEGWSKLCSYLEGQGIPCLKLGMRDEVFVSHLLQSADLGLVTTEPDLLGKSSTFAALQSHGLPVLTSEGLLPAISDARADDAGASPWSVLAKAYTA